jgi:hypothetical protein
VLLTPLCLQLVLLTPCLCSQVACRAATSLDQLGFCQPHILPFFNSSIRTSSNLSFYHFSGSYSFFVLFDSSHRSPLPSFVHSRPHFCRWPPVGVLTYACACPWSSSCVSVVWVRVCCEGPCWRGACHVRVLGACVCVFVHPHNKQHIYFCCLRVAPTHDVYGGDRVLLAEVSAAFVSRFLGCARAEYCVRSVCLVVS